MQLSLTPLAIKSDFKGQAHHQNGYDSGASFVLGFGVVVFYCFGLLGGGGLLWSSAQQFRACVTK